MPPTLDDTFTVCADVVSREVEGEAVILNLDTSTYFGLNDIGTHIWRLLSEGQSLGTILDVLHREYEAPRATLERDLLEVVAELESKQLITRTSA